MISFNISQELFTYQLCQPLIAVLLWASSMVVHDPMKQTTNERMTKPGE